MDQINLNSYSKISNFNVSRETCNELESYISLIQQKNKEINIISKKTTKKDFEQDNTLYYIFSSMREKVNAPARNRTNKD